MFGKYLTNIGGNLIPTSLQVTTTSSRRNVLLDLVQGFKRKIIQKSCAFSEGKNQLSQFPKKHHCKIDRLHSRFGSYVISVL